MGIEMWSRGTRVTLYAIAGVLTILFMLAYLGGITYLLALCENRSLCSHNGRMLLELVAFAVIAAIAFPWIGFLTRALRIKEEEQPWTGPHQVQQIHLGDQPDTVLYFGQSRVSGKVHAVDAGRHQVTVGELRLRFWGGYALRNGWIGAGDRAVFVYQRFSGANFVLAFWKGGNAAVRGVGGVIHTFFLALAVVGAGVGVALGEGRPMWFMPMCGILFVVSSGYLGLHFLAKRALRDFINSTISN